MEKLIIQCKIGSSEQDEVMNHYRNEVEHEEPYEGFDDWGYIAIGTGNREGLDIFDNIFEVPNYENYKILTYENWKNMQLPKMWCIKSMNAQEDKEINAYARKIRGAHWADDMNYPRKFYLLVSNGRYARGEIYTDSNFTEMNFEQFKKMTMKKIIGYELIDKGKEKVALAALGMLNKTAYTPFIIRGSIGYYLPKIKELDIFDWFEPVYEKVILSKDLVLGTQEREVTVFKDRVEMIDGEGDKRIFNNSSLKELLNLFREESFNGFSIKPTKFQIGCSAGIEISIEDLELITKAQNTL